MTEIYLIRHAEAEGNVFRRIHGIYDSLLTPRGHRQVACLEERFQDVRIDACYASDLTRTSLTARAIYIPKGLKLHRDPHFREVNLGVWEDLPFGYLDHYDAEQMYRFNHDTRLWRTPGAETFDEFTQRFIEGMRNAALDHDGGTIAVFAHGAVIRGMLMRLFYRDNSDNMPYCDNTGVSKLRFDKGEFTCDFIYDNSHLPQELSTFALQHWWRATGNRKDVNLYYLPLDSAPALPSGIVLPETDPNGITLAAILHDEPVALVSMAAPDGDMGTVLGMTLKDGMDGRLYGDQLLGTAFSRFRSLGCRNLALAPGAYPDDIVRRYEFDPITRIRSIDVHAFKWED